MKKLSLFFTVLFVHFLSFLATAQTQMPTDYFPGKWSVQVNGTPQGDGKMTVMLERKDGKLVGTIITKTGTEPTKITQIDEKEKSVKIYFNTNGFDVNLTMEKKDDDHVTGNVMDMFTAVGERVKETSSKQ